MRITIATKEGPLEIEADPVVILGFEAARLAVHHQIWTTGYESAWWHVTELTTGRFICEGDTKEAAVEKATLILDEWGPEGLRTRIDKHLPCQGEPSVCRASSMSEYKIVLEGVMPGQETPGQSRVKRLCLICLKCGFQRYIRLALPIEASILVAALGAATKLRCPQDGRVKWVMGPIEDE